MKAHDVKIQGRPCRMCGAPYPELHHLVHRGRMSKKSDRDNEHNCIPLCHMCHQNHHTAVKKIPRVLLTESELRFMYDNIHPGWVDRWYPEGQ